jgi:hypothetical protein
MKVRVRLYSNDAIIQDTPIRIDPADIDNTVSSWENKTNGVAGIPLSITFHAKDQHGNNWFDDETTIRIVATHVDTATDIDLNVVGFSTCSPNCENGAYIGTFTPTLAGTYTFRVIETVTSVVYSPTGNSVTVEAMNHCSNKLNHSRRVSNPAGSILS